MTVLGVLFLGACASAHVDKRQAMAAGFIGKSIMVDGQKRNYVVYVPREYSGEKHWPTIMFLHGKGECGGDGWKPVAQGIGRAVMNDCAKWPYIVIFPQKLDSEKQWEEFDGMVMAMLEATRQEYRIDPARTYLTGLSQGGHGTWTIGGMHPKIWAALVPICGYGDAAAIAPTVKDLPIWCFHGGADDLVKPEQSRRMIEAITSAGGKDVKYTEYPGVNHNSWDKAYGEADLPVWLEARKMANSK